MIEARQLRLSMKFHWVFSLYPSLRSLHWGHVDLAVADEEGRPPLQGRPPLHGCTPKGSRGHPSTLRLNDASGIGAGEVFLLSLLKTCLAREAGDQRRRMAILYQANRTAGPVGTWPLWLGFGRQYI